MATMRVACLLVSLASFAAAGQPGPSQPDPSSFDASDYHINWNERLGNPLLNQNDYVNPAGKFLVEVGGEGGNPAAFMESIFVELGACSTGHPHMHTNPQAHETIFMISGSADIGFMRGNYTAVEWKGLKPNEQVYLPGGFVHFINNPYCEPTTMLQVYSEPLTNIMYPHRMTINLPADVFAVETGATLPPAEALAQAQVAAAPNVDRIMFGLQECYERCGLPVPMESSSGMTAPTGK